MELGFLMVQGWKARGMEQKNKKTTASVGTLGLI